MPDEIQADEPLSSSHREQEQRELRRTAQKGRDDYKPWKGREQRRRAISSRSSLTLRLSLRFASNNR
jgi:hypothetical protein